MKACIQWSIMLFSENGVTNRKLKTEQKYRYSNTDWPPSSYYSQLFCTYRFYNICLLCFLLSQIVNILKLKKKKNVFKQNFPHIVQKLQNMTENMQKKNDVKMQNSISIF